MIRKNLFSFLLIVLTLSIKAQNLSFTVSQNDCNISTAVVTQTTAGALSYSWTVLPNCGNKIISSNTQTLTHGSGAYCCGIFTVQCQALGSFSIPIASSSQTVSMICQFLASATQTSRCSYNSTTLTASGAQSYTWQPGDLIGPSVVVTPSVTTCYTVTGTNPCGTTSAITCATVQSTGINNVITVTGLSNICAGATTTLTANGSSSYTWEPGNITSNTIAVTPTTSVECYTVSGAITGTCPAYPKTTCVATFTVPNISVNTPTNSMCPGGNVMLIANGNTGAGPYIWQPGNFGGSNPVVSPSVSTCYTVTAGLPGCTSLPKTACITVHPAPNISISSSDSLICIGSQAILTASGGLTYSWSNGSTGSLINVAPNVATSYVVMGANSFGCVNLATVSINVNNCTGIEAFQQTIQNINVYPNPAGNYVTLKSNTVEKTNYFVYDMVGKEIVKGSYNESTTIQLFSYAKGIYLIRCESSLGTSYTKLVIEN